MSALIFQHGPEGNPQKRGYRWLIWRNSTLPLVWSLSSLGSMSGFVVFISFHCKALVVDSFVAAELEQRASPAFAVKAAADVFEIVFWCLHNFSILVMGAKVVKAFLNLRVRIIAYSCIRLGCLRNLIEI